MKAFSTTLLLAASLMLAAPAWAADSAVSGKEPVEVFVTSWCPYCTKLESFLRENDIAYKRYDIEADAEGARIFEAIGAAGVPVSRIHGKTVIPGYDPEAITEALGPRA